MTENQEKELFTTLGKLVTSVNVIQSDVKDIKVTLGEHTRTLGEHTRTLGQHTRTLGEHTQTLGEHTRTLDGHTSRFDRLAGFVQIDVIPKVIEVQETVNRISETQSEQTFKIIEMLNRLDRVQIQLRALGEETASANAEIKEVRTAVHSLIDPIQIGRDLRENLRDIEQRITNIEQKLAN